MPTLTVTLSIRLDGASVFSDGPLVRRLEVDAAEVRVFEKASDGNPTTFTNLIATTLGTLRALLVRPSRDMVVRLNGQSNAGVPLSADGLLLILDGALTTATLASANRADADAVRVQVVAGGE